jgi:hypothetical protein
MLEACSIPQPEPLPWEGMGRRLKAVKAMWLTPTRRRQDRLFTVRHVATISYP